VSTTANSHLGQVGPLFLICQTSYACWCLSWL
jgi:hypothetical protein